MVTDYKDPHQEPMVLQCGRIILFRGPLQQTLYTLCASHELYCHTICTYNGAVYPHYTTRMEVPCSEIPYT